MNLTPQESQRSSVMIATAPTSNGPNRSPTAGMPSLVTLLRRRNPKHLAGLGSTSPRSWALSSVYLAWYKDVSMNSELLLRTGPDLVNLVLSQISWRPNRNSVNTSYILLCPYRPIAQCSAHLHARASSFRQYTMHKMMVHMFPYALVHKHVYHPFVPVWPPKIETVDESQSQTNMPHHLRDHCIIDAPNCTSSVVSRE